jgi:cytochrome c oxidase cbb3-type subunit 3
MLISVAGYLVILIACLVGGCFAYYSKLNAQLLRADGDTLPNSAGLVRFAVAEAGPVYARHCAACHGADLKGNSVLGAPNLTDPDWIYGQGRISEIEQTITYGIRSHNPRSRNLADMPGFAKAKPDERARMNPLSPLQIDDLVDYLFAVEGRGPNAAAASRGEALFLGAGGCFDCHGNDAIGDSYVGAVNLSDNIWLYGDGSASSVFRSIAKGHAGVCPAWVDKIRPAAIRALAVYIYERSHSANPKSTGGAS